MAGEDHPWQGAEEVKGPEMGGSGSMLRNLTNRRRHSVREGSESEVSWEGQGQLTEDLGGPVEELRFYSQRDLF